MIEAKERKRCDAVEAALAFVKKAKRLTKNQWREKIGCSGAILNPIIATLLEQGRIREGEIVATGKDGKDRTSEGFHFVQDTILESTPDNPGQPRTTPDNSSNSIAGPVSVLCRTTTPDTPPHIGGVQGLSDIGRPDPSTPDKKSPELVESRKEAM